MEIAGCDRYIPRYISVVVVAKANMKEARILLAQEIVPTMVSSSFMKLLKMLIENSVPATDTI